MALAAASLLVASVHAGHAEGAVEIVPVWQLDLGPRSPEDEQRAAVCLDGSVVVAGVEGRISVVGAEGQLRFTSSYRGALGGIQCRSDHALMIIDGRLMSLPLDGREAPATVSIDALNSEGRVVALYPGAKGALALVDDRRPTTSQPRARHIDANGRSFGFLALPPGVQVGPWVLRTDGTSTIFETSKARFLTLAPDGAVLKRGAIEGIVADDDRFVPLIGAAVALDKGRTLLWITGSELVDANQDPPVVRSRNSFVVLDADNRVMDTMPIQYGAPVGSDREGHVYFLNPKWAGVTLIKARVVIDG